MKYENCLGIKATILDASPTVTDLNTKVPNCETEMETETETNLKEKKKKERKNYLCTSPSIVTAKQWLSPQAICFILTPCNALMG